MRSTSTSGDVLAVSRAGTRVHPASPLLVTESDSELEEELRSIPNSAWAVGSRSPRDPPPPS